ncbi:hemolysin activation/secretion-like protein [Pseudomonas fluorescens]|uniref:hemolysin activation/secretion-like protein n=1 Tax=Pseudomonas TaxID=286 RepID=UPI000F014729|nr:MULTISPECIES: hemolysin activation/secretion-like protein [Pseudomonas]MBD8088670.1 hemolysin activation/secretion-like protein [Pseudomonas fluorescens]
MRVQALLASAALTFAIAAQAAPLIEGNTLISNDVISHHLGTAKPKNVEEAARIIVGIYDQYGYVGAKASIEGDKIRIIEPGASIKGDYDNAWLNEKGGVIEVGTIQNSMMMADVANRFEVLDVTVGNLKPDGTVDVDVKRSKATKPYEASINYSTYGQETSGRDVVTLAGATHVGGGVRVDASISQSAADLRSESKGGEYRSATIGARKATPYGEVYGSYSNTHNEMGGKEASYYDYLLAGDTQRATLGHRVMVGGNTTLQNSLVWTQRDLDFGLFNLNETQDYFAWNSRMLYSMGNHRFTVGVNQGLGGKNDYNLVPLLGSFNAHFTSGQLGYGYSSMLPGGVVGASVSANAFAGTRDMPSAERMSVGGPGRGSSHENGVVSGTKGYYGEARLYGVKTPLADFGLKPYLSVNGSSATSTLGDDISVYSAEVGVIGKWDKVSGSVNYARSLKVENLDRDERVNMSLGYQF